jgi:hypothetical protein
MSNASTGLWSALGALVGGITGALTARYVVSARPRYRYADEKSAPRPAGRPRGGEIEDAMVIGGGAGAVLGAFIGGAAAGEEAPPAPAKLTT